VSVRDPRSMLAIVPEPQQGQEIRRALRAADLPYEIPVRINLVNGIDATDVTVWDAVRAVTRRHDPFTVRLVGPQVMHERTVCLTVLGEGIRALQRDLHAAVGPGEFPDDDPRSTWDPVLPIAGTWTEMNRVELHDVATGVRNALSLPVSFRASVLYAFEDTIDNELPYRDFPLGAG
jgi:hypothetical protein